MKLLPADFATPRFGEYPKEVRRPQTSPRGACLKTIAWGGRQPFPGMSRTAAVSLQVIIRRLIALKMIERVCEAEWILEMNTWSNQLTV